MIHDGLWDPYGDTHMGDCGELCAKEGKYSRAEQDRYATQSYRRAEEAIPSADMNILAGDLPCAVSEREYEHGVGAAMPATVNPGDDAGALTAYPWTHAPHAPLPPPSLRIAALPASLTAVRDLLARAGPPPYLGITWRGGTAPDQQRGATRKLFKEIALPRLRRH